MNGEGLSRVANGVVRVARGREAGICQHNSRVPDVCGKKLSEVTFRGLEIRDLEILGKGSWT